MTFTVLFAVNVATSLGYALVLVGCRLARARRASEGQAEPVPRAGYAPCSGTARSWAS